MIPNSNLGALFRPSPTPNQIVRGSLITFSYSLWKNDPYPLLIVSKISQGKVIAGVNLHYLTFNYIRGLLQSSCASGAFSYASIKGDQYIVNAYRTYRWNAIRQVRVLDCDFLLKVMSMVRTFDPAEVEMIRNQVQQQLSQQMNPTANQMTTPGMQPPQV
jgi:hypothetical protein